MKIITILGLIVAVSACSTHLVKCHGHLRPINKPIVSAPSSHPAGESEAAVNEEPRS
jgi:hypothetical protein